MTTRTDFTRSPAPERQARGNSLAGRAVAAAALSAIAFTLANTVRGETERSSTDSDGLKAYYLAEGAIDRLLVYMESGFRRLSGPDGKADCFNAQTTRVLQLNFPTGVVARRVHPGKLQAECQPARLQSF